MLVTVKVALNAPAGTVTLAGTVAIAVLLLDRVTLLPPEGAGPSSVTVPVEVAPPVTEVGLRLSEAMFGGSTSSLTVRLMPPKLAVIVERVFDALVVNVVMVNVALLVPASTVTLAGTVAAAVLLLVRVTTRSTATMPVKVTVPVALLPPITGFGVAVTDDNVAAETVRVAVRFTPR